MAVQGQRSEVPATGLSQVGHFDLTYVRFGPKEKLQSLISWEFKALLEDTF